jgi:hypothetical protein
MANAYEALQLGRQEATSIAPALPRVAKPSPAVFGHIAAEGRSMLHCGGPADLDTVRMVFGRPYQLTQSLIDHALAAAPLSMMDAERRALCRGQR